MSGGGYVGGGRGCVRWMAVCVSWWVEVCTCGLVGGCGCVCVNGLGDGVCAWIHMCVGGLMCLGGWVGRCVCRWEGVYVGQWMCVCGLMGLCMAGCVCLFWKEVHYPSLTIISIPAGVKNEVLIVHLQYAITHHSILCRFCATLPPHVVVLPCQHHQCSATWKEKRKRTVKGDM